MLRTTLSLFKVAKTRNIRGAPYVEIAIAAVLHRKIEQCTCTNHESLFKAQDAPFLRVVKVPAFCSLVPFYRSRGPVQSSQAPADSVQSSPTSVQSQSSSASSPWHQSPVNSIPAGLTQSGSF